MLQLPQHGLSECTAVGGSTTWRFPRQILYLWPCIWFLHSRMGRRSHQDMIPWYSAECSNLERLHSRSHQWRLLSGKSIKHCLWIGLDLGFCCKLSRFSCSSPRFWIRGFGVTAACRSRGICKIHTYAAYVRSRRDVGMNLYSYQTNLYLYIYIH